MEVTAITGGAAMAVLTVFQLGLVAGAPWGAAAYGGGWPDVLPKGMRINSLVFGVLIYPLGILYLLDAGGVAELSWLPGSRALVMWVMAAFFAIGSIANFASRSRIERLWGPVALLVAVCCVIVALV